MRPPQKTIPLHVDDPTLQGFPRGESDGMDEKIQLSPILFNACENGFELSRFAHVQGHDDWRLELLSKRLDMLFGFVVEIGDGEVCTQCAEGLCAAPGNGLVVGDADDETLFSFERDPRFRKDWNIHATLSFIRQAAGRA